MGVAIISLLIWKYGTGNISICIFCMRIQGIKTMHVQLNTIDFGKWLFIDTRSQGLCCVALETSKIDSNNRFFSLFSDFRLSLSFLAPI